jgi:chemotaxis protein CheD
VSASSAYPVGTLIHVVQGEYVVTDDADAVLTTILGSCVAACIRDPIAGVGGMNHFLLPGDKSKDRSDSLRYGVHSMELLINGILQRGANRLRLEAKLFGGACVVRGLTTDVGAQNAEFALHFLDAEGIRCVGGSLGGDLGRRVRYWPITGRAALQMLAASETPAAEVLPRTAPSRAPAGGVELF